MDEKHKLTLEDIAAHQKLALVYSDELPPHVTGIVDDRPEPTYIALNSTQPPFEQHAFIGYAIGRNHLPRHPAKKPPLYRWLVNRKWNNRYMRLWKRTSRRWVHRNFSPEKQSERFSLAMMINLGYQEDLRLYLENHPEMTKWAVGLALVATARGLKQRLVRFVKQLLTSNKATTP